MNTTTRLGTHWPVPTSWEPGPQHDFGGSDGVLTLDSYEGELLDPARRRVCEDQRPGQWTLATTLNGVVVVGRYVRKGYHHVIVIARSDCPEGEAWLFPEVQASYVFSAAAATLADDIVRRLQFVTIPPAQYGVLDHEGHAAMGPVPLHPTWSSVEESTVLTPLIAGTERAVLSLIGGGVITLTDSAQCCGVLLAPAPWRRLPDREVAKGALQASLHGSDVRLIDEAARVWKWSLAAGGYAYEAFDSSSSTRVVGALWADPFGQCWHLRYFFGARHAKQVEADLLAAVD